MVEIPQILGLEFYGFVLPWIFTFAIVYGLISKLDLFGKKTNRVAPALAFVIAFFVTAVGGQQLATFFVTFFGGTSVFLAGFLVLLMFGALLGKDLEYWKEKQWALAAVIVIGALLFFASSGSSFLGVTITGDVATLLFALVVLLVAANFVMSGKDEKEDKKKGQEATP